MIRECPLCTDTAHELVWSFEKAPIMQVIRPRNKKFEEHFGTLEIVSCSGCGHIFNRYFDNDFAMQMYTGDFLSNVPVHVSMSKNLEAIAQWIDPTKYCGKQVVEIGGGSGHLSRIIAQTAKNVQVFEPCSGLSSAMLPEDNISLINQPFDVNQVNGLADLVICRQVLEHIANPIKMLTEIRSILKENGLFYFEVPRTEFIYDRLAMFDLHYAHVQYFTRRSIEEILNRSGFRIVRDCILKKGHDFGFLVSSDKAGSRTNYRSSELDDVDLSSLLRQRKDRISAQLQSLTGKLGLYGATWLGHMFFNVHRNDCTFEVVFDDNPEYHGGFLYCEDERVAIKSSGDLMEMQLDAVVIGAYLHEQVIREKMLRLGFTGQILCIENMAL